MFGARLDVVIHCYLMLLLLMHRSICYMFSSTMRNVELFRCLRYGNTFLGSMKIELIRLPLISLAYFLQCERENVVEISGTSHEKVKIENCKLLMILPFQR